MADHNGEKSKELSEKLQAQFEAVGATINVDESFIEAYDLDFTITRLATVHAHVNLGVHVTTSRDNLEEMNRFAQAAKRGIVLKAVYVEVHEVAIATGGSLVALGASLAFLFDKRFTGNRAMGVRIFEDCSFQFFDLEETVNHLERRFVDDDLAIGDDLGGRIIAYFTDKGFGFIQTEDDRKFFFHIANVVDDDLRARLPAYVLGEIIPVDFQYGGNDGKKYPKAINVSMNDDDTFYDGEDY